MCKDEWLSSFDHHPLSRQIKSKWNSLHDILHITATVTAKEQLADLQAALDQYASLQHSYFAAGLWDDDGDVKFTEAQAATARDKPRWNDRNVYSAYLLYAKGLVRATTAAAAGRPPRLTAALTANTTATATNTAAATAGATTAAFTTAAAVTAAAAANNATASTAAAAAASTATAANLHAANTNRPDAVTMAAYKEALDKFPLIEYTWKFYDHAALCHVVPQINHAGNLLAGSSWFIEAGNSAWKATLQHHTSGGGGLSGDSSSKILQAFRRMWCKTHPLIREHSIINQEPKYKQTCTACGLLRAGHVCKRPKGAKPTAAGT
jgi:hypothetical protein